MSEAVEGDAGGDSGTGERASEWGGVDKGDDCCDV